MNLTFNLEVSPGEWIIQGPASEPRHLESPLTDERFRGLVASLREWANRPVPLNHPDPLGTEEFVTRLAQRVSRWLSDVLLADEDRRVIAVALSQRSEVRLVIRVRSAAAEWDRAAGATLALPWELLAPQRPGEYPVRDGRLEIVREAVSEEAPELPSPQGSPLTVGVFIAAPADLPIFSYEEESFRLLNVFSHLGQDAFMIDLGRLKDLVDFAKEISPKVIHFSGYTLPGRLVFEDDYGMAQEVPIEQVTRQLRLALIALGHTHFPGLIFLSSCSPWTEEDSDPIFYAGKGLTEAAALHRAGFMQVIGEPADQLVLRCNEENDTDPILELRVQAEKHGVVHGLARWDEQVQEMRAKIPGSCAGLAAVIRMLRRYRPNLGIFIDNAESFQIGPAIGDPAVLGNWRPGLEMWWSEMERLADDGCLVLVTTRYAWRGLSPRAHVALGPMNSADSLRLIDTFDALRDLSISVRRRLAQRVDGHPRTVELLSNLIAKRRSELKVIADVWSELVEPALPAHEEAIREPSLAALEPLMLLPLPPKIDIADISKIIIPKLRLDFELIFKIGPEALEMLIMEMVEAMGFQVIRISNINRPDGGVDFAFWKRDPIPTLCAAQVKFHYNKTIREGPKPIRELVGVLNENFNLGLFVTNTTFTREAIREAKLKPARLRLRDVEDLKRWTQNDFKLDDPLRDFPAKIELASNLWLPLKK